MLRKPAQLLSSALVALLAINVAALGEVADELECTLTVEPGQSIQVAVDAAHDGAVICISEGEWQEDLAVTKPITLRGQGPGRTIIRGKSSPFGVLAIYCLDPERSRNVSVGIDGLTITGGDSAGISAGTSIQATVSNCDVQGNGTGIDLRDESTVEILDCRISENAVGITGMSSAQATMSSCAVSGNRVGGIALSFSAGIAISDSTIEENGRSGIALAQSAQATVTSSTLADNDGDGITLGDSSKATLIDCDVLENGFENALAGRYNTDGVRLNGTAQISLSSCNITGNAHGGVVLEDAAQANISGSALSANGRIGVWLWDSAQATLDRCTISDHPSAGVDARDEAGVVMTTCIVERNYAGICLWGSPHATLEANTVRNCEGRGVAVLGLNGEIAGFSGYVAGARNLVADNGVALNCDPCLPQYLCFLVSEEGGELDSRE